MVQTTETAKKRKKSRATLILSALSILLYRRSQKANALQKRVSLYLLFQRAPKAVFHLLNKLGCCLSYGASIKALEETSSHMATNLAKLRGQRVMGVIDNINFTTTVSEETSATKKSTRINAVLGFVAVLRVPNPFEEGEPQMDATQLPSNFFFQTPTETTKIVNTLVTLMARVLVKHTPALGGLGKIVSKPLTHQFSNFTSQPLTEQGIEILFYDENKSDEVPHILDYTWVRNSNYWTEVNQVDKLIALLETHALSDPKRDTLPGW